MNFKTFFLLIIVTLSSNSYAQWWVDGGNLIWPYGNVEIVNGKLTIDNILYHSEFDITGTDGSTSRFEIDDDQVRIYDSDGTKVFTISSTSDDLRLRMGELEGDYNSSRIDIVDSDDDERIKLSTDNNKIVIGDSLITLDGYVRFYEDGAYFLTTGSWAGDDFVLKIGDVESTNNDTRIEIEDWNSKILLYAQHLLLSAIPSDSTSVSTGELWFNSTTGAIHRKF